MNPAIRPIFVIGSPRSGTTLLRTILDAHPNIVSPQWETGLFIAFDSILNGQVAKLMNARSDFPIERADLVRWARECTLDLSKPFGTQSVKPRWAEKTPGHVFKVELIREVFPDAQFIHIIRNGSDVVKSLINRSWAPQGRLKSIRWAAKQWVDSVRAGRESGANLPSDVFYEIRYEQLLAEPNASIQRLCKFLDEPFVREMLEFHNLDRNHDLPELAPIQSTSLGQYSKLGILQTLIFKKLAGRMMRELNYEC